MFCLEDMNKEYIAKTIRFTPEQFEKIQKLADESQRDFTKQVRFMCEEYIKIKEG